MAFGAVVLLLLITRIESIKFGPEGISTKLVTEVTDGVLINKSVIAGVEERLRKLENQPSSIVTSEPEEKDDYDPIIIYYNDDAVYRADELFTLLRNSRYHSVAKFNESTDWSELGSEINDYVPGSMFIKYEMDSKEAEGRAKELKRMIERSNPKMFTKIYVKQSRHSHGMQLKMGLF